MRLYLVQHGDAVPEAVNPDRPLTEAGVRDVRRMAEFLGRAGIRVARVLQSGKLRAQQTAEALAAALTPDRAVEARGGLSPNDPSDPVAREAEGWREDTMIAGHLPFMARLADRLIAGREDLGIVAFRPGTVACLERGDDGRWALAWMLRPELLA